MFAIISNGVIALLVPAGTAFTWADISYPANWCNLSSPEEKANIGMVDVVYETRPDDRYYWVTEAAPALVDGVVRIGYTSTPKDLTGLLDQAITAVNDAAGSLLAPSDYMVLKSIENSSAVSPTWLAWRSQIRAQAKAHKALLTEIYSVEQLLALPQLVWANDPNYVAPVEPK
jgi:hypothetical protein